MKKGKNNRVLNKRYLAFIKTKLINIKNIKYYFFIFNSLDIVYI